MWIKLSAENGYMEAQNNLGYLYSNGLGVPHNYIKSHMWYNISASQTSSKKNISSANRELLEKKMTNEQIAKAQELATQCFAKNFKRC